jgi:hypothetical protein
LVSTRRETSRSREAWEFTGVSFTTDCPDPMPDKSPIHPFLSVKSVVKKLSLSGLSCVS